MKISDLWVKLGLQGEPRRKCKSPFRDDKTPSFGIYSDDMRWKDQGTGEGGDVFDFYAQATGCSLRDAITHLFDMAGVRPMASDLAGSIMVPHRMTQARVVQINRPIKEPVFLPKRVPDEALQFFEKRGISDSTVLRLLRDGDIEFEGGKLVFNYNTGKKIRSSWDTSKNNRWLSGSADNALWRYHDIQRPNVNSVFIGEGETDIMRVMSLIPIPKNWAVVSAPAASWQPDNVLWRTISNGRRVILAFDKDKAGFECAKRVFGVHVNSGSTGSVSMFPWSQIEDEGKDLCEVNEEILQKTLEVIFNLS